MTFDIPAFLSGLILAGILASDAVLISLVGKWLGFNVEEASLFFGKVVKRKIGKAVWTVGWIPMGNSVKIRGMYREEGVEEAVHPDDFDQQPFAKKVLLLLFDKLWLATLLVFAVLMMPGGSFGDSLDKVWRLLVFILSGSEGDLGYSLAGSGNFFFLMGCLSMWNLIFALIPSAGNKTQILLIYLLGLNKKKSFTTISMVSGLLAMAIFSYVIYCLYQFTSTALPGDGWTIWANGFGGALLVGLLSGLLVDVLGKRIVQD